MQKIYFLVLFSLGLGAANGQELELLTSLSPEVSESSALIFLEGKLITLNDSGNSPNLFEIDSVTGNVTRTISVINADNVDWEALTCDENYIYIGDFGNNNGDRIDLRVLRIAKSEYFENSANEVSAEIISFAYADQTDFSSSPFQTKFDAEAMVARGDSLYIFTKNWTANTTYMYPLSKIPGDYIIQKTDSLDVAGWITDATYHPQSQELFLLGYTPFGAFGVSVSGFESGTDLASNSESYSLNVPLGYSYQLEGVVFIHPSLLYFSSEGGFTGDSGLLKWSKGTTGLDTIQGGSGFLFYPNPASGHISVSDCRCDEIVIYDMNGQTVLASRSDNLDISTLGCGTYLAKAFDKSGEYLLSAKFIVR